jgi:predicted  nucleic acid-binding Zn-ribbon protein
MEYEISRKDSSNEKSEFYNDFVVKEYKTVKDRNDEDVEILDNEYQTSLSSLESEMNNIDKEIETLQEEIETLQERKTKLLSLVDEINNLEEIKNEK